MLEEIKKEDKWMYVLWEWANENNIPELELIDDVLY